MHSKVADSLSQESARHSNKPQIPSDLTQYTFTSHSLSVSGSFPPHDDSGSQVTFHLESPPSCYGLRVVCIFLMDDQKE